MKKNKLVMLCSLTLGLFLVGTGNNAKADTVEAGNISQNSQAVNSNQKLTTLDKKTSSGFVEQNNYAYKLDENNLTASITKYNGSKLNIVIPNGIDVDGKYYKVTEIGKGAFNNKGLTSVDIPDSISDIGYWAFNNNHIQNLKIPDSVKNISGMAFSNNDIKSVTFLPSVQNLGEWSFMGNNLSTVYLPYTTQIASNTFDDDVKIIRCVDEEQNGFKFAYDDSNSTATILNYNGLSHDVTIPSKTLHNQSVYKITEVGTNSFEGLGLNSVVIPDSIKSIDDNSFAFNKLSNIVIPDSVDGIGMAAFANNLLTGSVDIPNNVQSIGKYAFQNNKLSNANIANSNLNIGENAFDDNINMLHAGIVEADKTNLKFSYNQTSGTASVDGFNNSKSIQQDLVIPDTISHDGKSYKVTSVSDNSFNFKGLTSVSIPNSIEIIGSDAFSWNNMTTLNLPASVKSLGNFAFGQNKFVTVNLQNKNIDKPINAFNKNWQDYSSNPVFTYNN